jgi:uncharacterized protein (TIGR02466 family)
MVGMTDIFSTKIYEAHMLDFESIKQPIIDQVLTLFGHTENFYVMLGSSKTSYNQVNGELHKHVDIAEICKFVETHAKIYWNELEYDPALSPVIKNSWANICPSGGSLSSHNHAPFPISGAFYLNADESMGNQIFEHPLDQLMSHQPFTKDVVKRTYKKTVATGTLFLFPGYLNHYVEKNSTDKVRLTIGFDIGV